MKCLCCGKELKSKFGRPPKFCSPECRYKASYEKKKLKREEVTRTSNGKYCAICGRELKGRQTKLCSRKRCHKKDLENRKAEYREVYKTIKPPTLKKQKNPTLSIEEINARARAEELSYGQYTAKYGL